MGEPCHCLDLSASVQLAALKSPLPNLNPGILDSNREKGKLYESTIKASFPQLPQHFQLLKLLLQATRSRLISVDPHKSWQRLLSDYLS